MPGGSTTATVGVEILDDVHDEGSETFTLTLSSPTGGRLVDGTATGTIKNHDPLPRALMARFGRAAAQHVVENVEERMAARRDPGVEVRIGGYDLFGQGPVRHDQQIPMHGIEDRTRGDGAVGRVRLVRPIAR